jgi:hypothetical protein
VIVDVPIPLIDRVAAATVVVAVALLGFALRGRRVSDHPVCRRCGFDLFGKPETSTRCGECGADLARRRAVRQGDRRRRARLAWLSLLLAAIAGAKLGVDGYHVTRDRNWARYKPTSWLAREIESSTDIKLRDDSRAELTRRLNGRQLSAAWVDRLTQRALAIQADVSMPWDNWWGDLVQDARATSQLPDEAWHRYLSHAWPMHVEVPPLQRRGQPVTARIVRDPRRHGLRFTLAETSVLTASFGGQRLQAVSDSSRALRLPVIDARFALAPEQVDALGDGPLPVVVAREMHVKQYTRPSASRVTAQYPIVIDEFTGTTTLPEVTTTIAPADHVVLDRDPAAATAVRGAVSIARCTYGLPPAEAGRTFIGYGTFVVTFRVQSPPQALAYEVLLRTDKGPAVPAPFTSSPPATAAERRAALLRGPLYFRLGQLVCYPHFKGDVVVSYDDVPNFGLKRYTVVLRPSVSVARGAGLDSVSGEEIVFTEVKVERPGASK